MFVIWAALTPVPIAVIGGVAAALLLKDEAMMVFSIVVFEPVAVPLMVEFLVPIEYGAVLFFEVDELLFFDVATGLLDMEVALGPVLMGVVAPITSIMLVNHIS